MDFVPAKLNPAAAPHAPCRRDHAVAGPAICLGVVVLLAGHPARASVGHRPEASQDSEHPPTAGHAAQRPGYLGVFLRDLDAAETTRLRDSGPGATEGVMIATVDRDAPAWTAGLRPGDILLEVNGQPVDGVELLRRRLREFAAGTTITLRLRRGETDSSYAVTLGDQEAVAQNALSLHVRQALSTSDQPPPASTLNALPPAPPPTGARAMASTLFDALMPGSTYTGLEVNALTPQLAAFFGVHAGGLLITDVRQGSPAAGAGLQAGDVIVRAGNRAVTTRSNLAHALRGGRGNPIPLAVLRDHRELALSLLPGKRKHL